MRNLNCALVTLGCKVNQYEIDEIAAKLASYGVNASFKIRGADIAIVNTCSVTNISDKKSRQLIRRVRKDNPNSLLIVTGCYAESYPDNASKIEGVDLVVANQNKKKIVQTIAGKMGLKKVNEIKTVKKNRPRKLLKVVDGCESFCSYCSIPFFRGKIKSREPNDIVKEFSTFLGQGIKEVVLTGINLGKYGQDLNEKNDLSGLISKLAVKGQGKIRIRLSSIELNDIDDELPNLIQKEIVCKHLHIPLQSGSDNILTLMNRDYVSSDFLKKVRLIKKIIPGIAITTDIIVGFPGESDKNFNETLRVVEKSGFSKIHVFKYSARKGTAAANFSDQVDDITKQERSAKLLDLQRQLTQKFTESFIGQKLELLIEGHTIIGEIEHSVGLTTNYLKVYIRSENHLPGDIVQVKISEVRESLIFGDKLI